MTLYESPNLIIFTGVFDDVVTKNINDNTLCAIIGYADFKVTNINFRSYIFFGLRIVVKK